MTTASIVIVNWNGAHLLPACLDAIARQSQPAQEVTVVDNASSDSSRTLLHQRYPWVRVLPMPRNLGFAGGANAGIAASTSDIVVTLNNDAIPEPGWLAALCAPFASQARLGSTMSTMLFAQAPAFVAAAGLAIHENGLVLEDLALTSRTNLPVGPRPIFGPSAGAAAYRRAMLDDVGFFDEYFFLYLEDADLAWRARLRGWESLHVPEAVAAHLYSASSKQGSPLKSFHLARNRLWCLRKNLPLELAQLYARSIAGYELGALAYAVLRRDWASVRGRRIGLCGAQIASQRRMIQARRTVDSAAIERWLKPAPGWRAILRQRQATDRLVVPQAELTTLSANRFDWRSEDAVAGGGFEPPAFGL
ncbi:MAG: glycosyltransferase family 2 protein [Thermomicrobiales bacterium]